MTPAAMASATRSVADQTGYVNSELTSKFENSVMFSFTCRPFSVAHVVTMDWIPSSRIRVTGSA